MIRAVLLLTFGFLMFGFGTSAQERNPLLCQNPVQFVCGNKAQDDRELMIQEYVAPFKKQALEEAAYIVDIDVKDLNPDNFKNLSEVNTYSDEKAPTKAEKIKRGFIFYHSRLNHLILLDFIQRAGDQQKIVKMFHIDRIKYYLSVAIRQTVSDPALQQQALALLARVEMPSVDTLLNIHNERLDRQVLKNYFEGCGYDGLEDNAFAFDVKTDQGKKLLIIPCAGTVVAALVTLQKHLPESEFFTGLFVTLSHEISHHFDGQTKELAGMYTGLNRCLMETAVAGFKPEPKKKNQTPARILRSHIGEITADMWSGLALAGFLKEERLTLIEKIKLFRINFADICNTEDDGIHPDGNFRINFVRGLRPFSEAFGCEVPAGSCQPN